MQRTTVGLIVILTCGFLVAPLAVGAQTPTKVARIGLLSAAGNSSFRPLLPSSKMLLQGLGELGYVEGRDFVIEYRGAEANYDRLPDLAAELVGLQVDIIVAGGGAPAQAARNATRTIPIVFFNIGDPVQSGFVASLARPGGNITGVADLSGTELEGKRLERLKEAVPGITRIAVPWNPPNPDHAPALKVLEVAAQSVGVQLQPLEVQSLNDLDSAFVAMSQGHADALIVLGSALHGRYIDRIADFALKGRLPAIGGTRIFAEVGGLMAYGVNEADRFRRVATYVDKILKGAKPAELPVEQAMKFEFVINLKTAKALGLTIPPTILFQANEVIQ